MFSVDEGWRITCISSAWFLSPIPASQHYIISVTDKMKDIVSDALKHIIWAPKGSVPEKVKTLWVLGEPKKTNDKCKHRAKHKNIFSWFVTCNTGDFVLKSKQNSYKKKVKKEKLPLLKRNFTPAALLQSLCLIDRAGLNRPTLGLMLIVCRVGNWVDYIGRSQGKRDKQVTWASSAKLNWEGEGTMSSGS